MLQEPLVEEVHEIDQLVVIVVEVHRGLVLIDDAAKVAVCRLLLRKLRIVRHGHDFFFVDMLFDDVILHRRQDLSAQAVIFVLVSRGERLARFFHVFEQAAMPIIDEGDSCFKIFQEAVHTAHSIFCA